MPASVELLKNNPKFTYFNVCIKDGELALPLLAYVVNKQLTLHSYKLSLGHIEALAKTFKLQPTFVSRFLFDNCGLSDASLEHLFNSLDKLEKVTSIVVKNNEVNEKAVTAIAKVLKRPFPACLKELSLVNCSIPKSQIARLIE